MTLAVHPLQRGSHLTSGAAAFPPSGPSTGGGMTESHPLLDPAFGKHIVVCPTSCWMWGGHIDRYGYGKKTLRRRVVQAHRLTWMMMRGEIPTHLQIDHLCRVRSCVNPAHMELVTSRENTLRGLTLPATNARKSECLRGHQFTAENIYWSKTGKRNCKACVAIRERARPARLRSMRCAPEEADRE